jgi:hypothetical protein
MLWRIARVFLAVLAVVGLGLVAIVTHDRVTSARLLRRAMREVEGNPLNAHMTFVAAQTSRWSGSIVSREQDATRFATKMHDACMRMFEAPLADDNAYMSAQEDLYILDDMKARGLPVAVAVAFQNKVLEAAIRSVPISRQKGDLSAWNAMLRLMDYAEGAGLLTNALQPGHQEWLKKLKKTPQRVFGLRSALSRSSMELDLARGTLGLTPPPPGEPALAPLPMNLSEDQFFVAYMHLTNGLKALGTFDRVSGETFAPELEPIKAALLYDIVALKAHNLILRDRVARRGGTGFIAWNAIDPNASSVPSPIEIRDRFYRSVVASMENLRKELLEYPIHLADEQAIWALNMRAMTVLNQVVAPDDPEIPSLLRPTPPSGSTDAPDAPFSLLASRALRANVKQPIFISSPPDAPPIRE